MQHYPLTTTKRKSDADRRRSLRRHGPRYVRARGSKRLTAVWSLRPRHMPDGVSR